MEWWLLVAPVATVATTLVGVDCTDFPANCEKIPTINWTVEK